MTHNTDHIFMSFSGKLPSDSSKYCTLTNPVQPGLQSVHDISPLQYP
jgi:hypothetical protein